MKLIGKNFSRELFYFDLESEVENLKAFKNWILFFICNTDFDEKYISNVFKTCIKYGALEFRSQGKKGEDLHLLFDKTKVELEINEKQSFIHICTTGDETTGLDNALWECFYANLLPDNVDYDNIKIFCTTSDNVNYLVKIQNIFNKIKSGWVPE